MDQLICPECDEPAGFSVVEDGPWTNLSVSADREVRNEAAVELVAITIITCDGCGEVPTGDLWDEIYELVHG